MNFVDDFFSLGSFGGVSVSGGYREHSLKTFVLREITNVIDHLEKSEREVLFKSICSLYLHHTGNKNIDNIQFVHLKANLDIYTGGINQPSDTLSQSKNHTPIAYLGG